MMGNEDVLKKINNEILIVDRCNGKKHIFDEKDLFYSMDPNFKKWRADENGFETNAIMADVYEQVKNATLLKMLNSLTGKVNPPLFKLEQVSAFVKKYPDYLRGDGYATFFPYESYDQVFFARVGIYPGNRIYINPLYKDHPTIWQAKKMHRFFVPVEF